MKRQRPRLTPRKLLVASVGVMTVSYLGQACEKQQHQTTGNLMPPDPQTTDIAVGNLMPPDPPPSSSAAVADSPPDAGAKSVKAAPAAPSSSAK